MTVTKKASLKGSGARVGISDVNWQEFLNKMYPVGSIYLSISHSTAASVANALGGGTWQAWGAGRVPVGVNTSDSSFNTVQKTGGEKTHKLTSSELPSLSGTMQCLVPDGFATSGIISGQSWNHNKRQAVNDSGQTTQYGFKISFGGNGTHNNLQPYITVYMWRRVA